MKTFISVYEISYKTSTGAKPLRIRFDKINEIYCGSWTETKHLVLFEYGLFQKIRIKIKYVISKKSRIKNSINHNFGRINIESCNYLPIQKILTFHNVILLIKSVINKNKNKYYYNIFLEKGLYKDKSNTEYF